ncbi:MAG: hypothetical protein ACTTH5_00680 [Wolinella sp.]
MKKFLAFSLAIFTLAYADNLIDMPRVESEADAFEGNLKRLTEQNPPNTAYYVNARTGEVFSVSTASTKLKTHEIPKKVRSLGKIPAPMPAFNPCRPSKIPYEIQEEHIELLP